MRFPLNSLAVCGLLSLPLLQVSAHAQQDFTLEAQVDRGQMGLGEEAVLTVSLSGASTNLPEPRLPPMPAFDVRGAGTSRNISFINGAVSNTVQYRYVLTPRIAGKAAIGPITAGDGAAMKQTAPFELTVLRNAPQNANASPAAPQAQSPAPTARAPSGPDLFVTAEVDKPRPFVNEQVVLTVRFYTGVALMGNAQWQPPATQGFLVEELPSEPGRQVVEHGRRYVMHTIRLALFPAQPGELTIGPGTVVCQIQQEMQTDPSAPDFFQRFFSQGLVSVQKKAVSTRPLTLRVEPLPAAGKPSSFSGLVGSLRISASSDRRKLKAGEPLNLSLVVEGRGNFKSLSPPALPEMSQLRAYDTVSSVDLAKDASGVHGSKTFKTVLVPKASGKMSIPPVALAYFDPSRKAYLTTQTRALDLDVEPGTLPDAAIRFTASAVQPQSSGILPVSEDIRHVKPAGARRVLPAAAAAATAWPAHAFFLAVFFLSFAMKFRRELLAKDPALLRKRRALSRASEILRSAGNEDPAKLLQSLSEALEGFLADKLGCARSGLTLRQVQQDLRERFPSLPEELHARLKTLWEELGMLRFSQSSSHEGTELLLEKTRSLIEALDGGMRK
ncbi:MAG: BatD family protein [Elusimicrobiota bacterium]|jgi:hypothetical protein